MRTKREKLIKRKLRIRKKIFGVSERPRVSVFRSNKHCFVQVINDEEGKTLIGIADKDIAVKNDEKKSRWYKLGELIGGKLAEKKINSVVFDRSGYKYHGRVKDVAEGIRSKKINF